MYCRKLEVKQEYFAKMDSIFPEKTILATNTSAIAITEIAEKSVHKERIIRNPLLNPAYLVPLVEVIKTKYVSDEVVQATYNLLAEAGKKPVIVKKMCLAFLQTVCSTHYSAKLCRLLKMILPGSKGCG